MLICSDIHLGVNRRAGATPASAAALRQYTLETFLWLLRQPTDSVLILGDLFDSAMLDVDLVVQVFQALQRSAQADKPVYLAAGNHDLSRSGKGSNFTVLQVLCAAANVPHVHFITQPTSVGPLHVVPHLQNQDEFDQALRDAAGASFLATHCNYDSPFAEEQDHALNLSRTQARQFGQVILGHEHSHRVAGNVWVLGTPCPTNFNDVAGQYGRYAELRPDGTLVEALVPEPPKVQSMDWREPEDPVAPFVRVGGTAKASEAKAALETVAELRASAPPEVFLVGNFVQVETLVAGEGLADALEQFNLFEVFKQFVPEEFHDRVERDRREIAC